MPPTLSYLLAGCQRDGGEAPAADGGAALLGEPAFRTALARVLVRMATAEGDFDAAEVERIEVMFKQITGEPFNAVTDQAEISRVIAGFGSVSDDVAPVTGTLDKAGKEFMLRLAVMVAATDRLLHGDEISFARELAATLGLPQARVDTIIREETAS